MNKKLENVLMGYKRRPSSLLLRLLSVLAMAVTAGTLILIVGYILVNGVQYITP